MIFSPDNIIYPRNKVADKETDFSAEQLEILDVQLENAIVLHSEKINEGNNGVIFRLRLEDVTEVADLVGLIDKKRDGEKGPGNVVKILKLYRPGAGRREFEMQARANEIIGMAPNRQDVAQVPEPILFRELTLSQEGQNYLKSRGVACENGKVEAIIMDFVEGLDVATILYRAVVRTHPKSRHLAGSVEEMSFAELHAEVTRALGFAVPGGRARSESEREFERVRVEAENAELLFSYLEKNKFQLDPRIPDRIDATMALFHQNGLAFRDGHHRNFMVHEAGDKLQVFIVDYGSSTTFEGRLTEDVYADGERRYPKDDTVSRTLRRFTKTAEQRADEASGAFVGELQGLRRRLERQGDAWRKMMQDLAKEKIDLSVLYERVVSWPGLRGQGLDMKIKVFSLALYDLVESGGVSSRKMKAAVKKYLENENLSPVVIKSLNNLHGAI